MEEPVEHGRTDPPSDNPGLKLRPLFIQHFPTRFPRLHRWGERLLKLAIGQGILQTLNLVIGVLLVRWMSVEAYAQYGVVFGFQSALGSLVDLGFCGCIVSLVGNRRDQPEVIGGYIAAARWFRFRMFVLLLPLSALFFYWIGVKHGWNLGGQVLLFGCIIVALFSQGQVSWYSAPLIIHHRIGRLYRVQSLGAMGRLVAGMFLKVVGSLSALTMTAVNTAALFWTALAYTRAAQRYLTVPRHADREVRREMLHYLAPLIPGVVFTALQGQLLVFLISIFGKTQNIAEVAALGRLGQVFVLLGAVNATLVEPYFARLDRERLWTRYGQVVGAAIVLAAGLAAFAFLQPAPLLWFLGSKYAHLDRELGWMVAGGSLSYIGGVMWSIHSARKWIYWWGSFLYIALVTAIQAIFIACVELNTTLSVLYLGFCTNLAILAVHALTALVSFLSEHRKNATPLRAPSE